MINVLLVASSPLFDQVEKKARIQEWLPSMPCKTCTEGTPLGFHEEMVVKGSRNIKRDARKPNSKIEQDGRKLMTKTPSPS